MPTLRQLWSRGQQVILSYEDEAAVSRHAELWPGIPYWWGNKVKPQDLVHYLELMKSRGRPGECHLAPRHLATRVSKGMGLALGSSGEMERDVLADITVSTTGGQHVDRMWTSVWTLLCLPHGARTWTSLGSLSSPPALCNRRNS